MAFKEVKNFLADQVLLVCFLSTLKTYRKQRLQYTADIRRHQVSMYMAKLTMDVCNNTFFAVCIQSVEQTHV